MLVSVFFHLADGSFPYFSTGSIDDALESDIVIRVAERAEVANDIFDFFSIEKFESAENLVGNSLLDEHLLEDL